MKNFKKMIRKHHKPLEQVVKRYNEQLKNMVVQPKTILNSDNIILNYEHNKGPLLENSCTPQYLKLTIQNKICINIQNSSDKYIYIN